MGNEAWRINKETETSENTREGETYKNPTERKDAPPKDNRRQDT